MRTEPGALLLLSKALGSRSALTANEAASIMVCAPMSLMNSGVSIDTGADTSRSAVLKRVPESVLDAA